MSQQASHSSTGTESVPDMANGTRTNPVMSAYRRHAKMVHGMLSLLLAVVLWEFAASRTSSLVLVSLPDIGDALVNRFQSGLLWIDVKATSRAFLIGLTLASVTGILFGVAMATTQAVYDIFDPWVSALYSTPVIALAPLFIVVFGIELASKVAVTFLLAIFPVVINTAAGIRTTDRRLIEGAYSFGASRFQIFTKVMLPSSVPFIITGLRLAVGRGLIGVVVAEFFGARAGVGHMIFTASQRFDTATLWSGVFILAAVGTIMIKLMYRLERWIAPWRETDTD